MKRKRVFLITLGKKGDTSYNMFSALGDFVSERYECRRTLLTLARGSASRNALALLGYTIRSLKDVMWADTVLVHVAAAPSVLIVAAARLLMKKVVIFQWDVYPTTLAGVRYQNRPVHRILYKVEDFGLALANLIVVPSDDFLAYVKRRKATVLPLWPQKDLTPDPITARPIEDGVIHIAFAGQINELRGIAECVTHLGATTTAPIALHAFSANILPLDSIPMVPSVRVEQHGILSREELQRRLTTMHFGLVSLNPRMDQPGFPSKTFDYIAAGLPVLYFGRPLPAYTSKIEECGVGIDITDRNEIDLVSIYTEMRAGFEASRRRYLSYTELGWNKLADIC